MLSVLIYGLSSFCQMSYDTIFPLLLFNKRDHGGFELDAVGESWISTFGTALQVFSCMFMNVSLNVSLIISLNIFHFIVLITPLWSRLLSYRSVVIWSSICFSICIFLTPIISLFNHLSEIVIIL